MDIKPGSSVTVEIIKAPASEAGYKTLARICRKDPSVARRQRWIARHRPSHTQKQRGGRLWNHRMASQPGVDILPGKKYQVRATVDVLRDLASVAKCVQLTPA